MRDRLAKITDTSSDEIQAASAKEAKLAEREGLIRVSDEESSK